MKSIRYIEGENEIKLAGLERCSFVDGPGLRLVLFAQGCPHRCPGCHNPETHLPLGGKPYAPEELFELFKQNDLLRGVTLSGGEPFLQARLFAALAKKIQAAGGDVITYTGYTYHDLVAMDDIRVNMLLAGTDLLIDGPFIAELKTLHLPFRGSSNQQLIPLSENGLKLNRDIEAIFCRRKGQENLEMVKGRSFF